MLLGKSIAVWLLILVLAVANGALREALLVPGLGRTGAYAASGVLLSLIVLGTALVAAPWLGRMRPSQALLVGLLWLALTLAFEFGFGLFVQHKPMAVLLEAYSFRDGNLWPLVLAVIALAPLAAARLRGLAP
jgi:hypothetical protein